MKRHTYDYLEKTISKSVKGGSGLKKIIIAVIILVVIGGGIYMAVKAASARNRTEYTEVEVKRGNLTEKALAIGKIDPDHEIVIKSQVSGILEEIHREVGEEVTAGDPLMVIKPEPTPMELAEARRMLEIAELNDKFVKTDLERAEALYKDNLISGKEYENSLKTAQETAVQFNQARERLELLEKGSSQIGDVLVESVIRAPTSGMILQRMVNVGDPVVPLTSYQPGTELMRIASMDDLIFIGTVDEIDVGKISPGMRAEITIGALPNETLLGELYFISPKSRLKDNVVVFDIKIRITDSRGVNLRAGYSASADLIINERRDVLYIPERLVTFEDDDTFVDMRAADADSLVQHQIALGFSDGLSVEVTDGLAEGEMIVEQ